MPRVSRESLASSGRDVFNSPPVFSIVIGSKPVLPCTEKRETVGCRVSCGKQNLTVSSAGGTAWLLTTCIARNTRAHTGRIPAAEVFSLIPDNPWHMAHTSETKESEKTKHRDDTHWSAPGGVQGNGAATLPTLVILGAGWFSRDFGRSVVIHPLARRNGHNPCSSALTHHTLPRCI